MITDSYFLLDKIDHQEFTQILLAYFGHAQTLKGGFRYRKEGELSFIDIEVNKKGVIDKIVLSDDFPEDELKNIKKKIEEILIDNQIPKIGQVICFSYTKIKSFFKYRDLFQLLPVPKNAPQPTFSAAEHPFILEFSYISCLDGSIDYMRRSKKYTTYLRLLNLFSNTRIFTSSSNRLHHWVLNIDDPKGYKSEMRQAGYYLKDMPGIMDKFSDHRDIEPIQTAEAAKYYADPKVRQPEPFTFPDNLEQSLDLALSLDEEDWRRFFMACSWYFQYNDIWEGSNSAAFIALVSALECLTKKPDSCKKCYQVLLEATNACNKCRQPIYGITKTFKEFLEIYVPFIDQMPKEKKLLYDVRSKLAHGLDLLSQDLEPWNFMMSLKVQEQYHLQRSLHFITGTAIYNWLWSKKP